MDGAIEVLYVDDNRLDRELVRDALTASADGFAVTEAANRDDFLARLAGPAVDIVLTDFNILGFEGLQVLDAVGRVWPAVPVIVVTGTGSEEVAVEAMKRGAADYLIKTPQHIQRLPRVIHAALERVRLRHEREHAEAARRQSEQHRLAMLEAMPDTVVRLSADGVMLDYHPGLLPPVPLPPEVLIGRRLDELAPPELVARTRFRLAKALAEPGIHLHEEELSEEGRVRQFEIRTIACAPDEVMEIVRDVTEARQLQTQLRQASKMEAVGQLAGGIAHDFNNLLTTILACAEFVLEDLPPEAEAREDVVEIRRAGQRAAQLTRQLLAISRRQPVTPRPVDLNHLIDGLEGILRRTLGEDVRLELGLAPGLGCVLADDGQLEQILVNLAVNARDAMPDGGTLSVATSELELGDDPHLARGPYVRLEVSDTGCGMEAGVRARIFEPFFTTKPPGEGTGLGLATVYGIVKQHRGRVVCESEPGRGTRFTIDLPRSDEDELPMEAPEPVVRERREGVILLVEDEEPVRALAARCLRHAGYEVVEAADADAAMAAHADLARLDLLLTDLILPGENGRLLADRLQAERPGLPVLFVSGYAENTIARHGLLEPGIDLLEKPFNIRDLVRRAHEAMARATQRGDATLR